ncbi:MAG TPA: GAF domain-containing protein [Anaerolineaceae bacterium]
MTFAFASIALATAYDYQTSRSLELIYLCSLAGTGAAIINLAFVYPHEDLLIVRFPGIRYLSMTLALVIALFLFLWKVTGSIGLAGTGAETLVYLFCAFALIFTISWISRRRLHHSTPVDREQLRVILLGALLSFSPLALWSLSFGLLGDPPFSNILILPLGFFPVISGYAVQRYRYLHTDTFLSRAVLYGGMTVICALAYALLTSGLGLFLGQIGLTDSVFLNGLVIFLLALLILPLRDNLQKAINAYFFRGQRVYQERMQEFGSELTRIVSLSDILSALWQTITETLAPSTIHVFVYNPLWNQYAAAPAPNGIITSDLRFAPSSPLVLTLQRQEAIHLGNTVDLPDYLKPEEGRMALLGSQIYIPLPGQQRLAGWLALGERQSGDPYTILEIQFIESLCDQAALAIERAQVVAHMEKRVREMNVLTRVAQGVNITISVNDILELIYAQTMQIVRGDLFHILLYDADTETYQYMFYLEGEDRLTEYENRPIASDKLLEQEVVRQRRPILADDYARECHRQNTILDRADINAWIGVPLNTGAQTIGALCLGSLNPSVTYSQDQQNLLTAIADQAAGAIFKARILAEMERRTRQLTILNEMTRQLTSTLAIEPLLSNILNSAVDILDCEAGSLLMVDEQTDELVFRVTAGPVANELVNRRLPPGTGVVGTAVQMKQPMIVNDVHASTAWFSRTDQQTGFISRALLVVPLLVKDKAIGVLEVINKRDGSFFVRDDQALLEAFASQASVAIENARLYTMTDQALAVRVEELSVMQRIDRELNTSLDTRRAMQITLEWAMRQSRASAGLVGIVQENNLLIMASQGYMDELSPYPDSLIPTQVLNLQDVIGGGVPVRRGMAEVERNSLLREARGQVIIPIRRETQSIGLLLLESTTAEIGSEDSINFLVRLSDHASIAISNAQLYAAVQTANIAKSEFVSFVSHELKNPMTSIKGYTELLAGGAVGPVNEMQANFLSTIRSNVERMSTLVSDLADVSRIEAGRLKLDYKIHAVKDVIDEVIRSLRRQIEEKTQILNVQLPDGLPLVWADRTRLVQIVTNLVSNANKYTSPGGQIFVRAETCPNQWDTTGARRVVHLWVQDTGIGISPEDQKKIFQKFFRSEDPKTREAPGTGLGLNITRSLVEMMGGKIWFESEFRKGTIFHFTIPVAEQ